MLLNFNFNCKRFLTYRYIYKFILIVESSKQGKGTKRVLESEKANPQEKLLEFEREEHAKRMRLLDLQIEREAAKIVQDKLEHDARMKLIKIQETNYNIVLE
jgi:hypothetical protein